MRQRLEGPAQHFRFQARFFGPFDQVTLAGLLARPASKNRAYADGA